MFVFYSRDFVFHQDSKTLDQHFSGYTVPLYRVTDIDTPEDWKHAEKMFTALSEI
jgi:CMP-N-acetylneuraminic acid synthetase